MDEARSGPRDVRWRLLVRARLGTGPRGFRAADPRLPEDQARRQRIRRRSGFAALDREGGRRKEGTPCAARRSLAQPRFLRRAAPGTGLIQRPYPSEAMSKCSTLSRAPSFEYRAIAA